MTAAGRGIQFLFTSFAEFYAEIGPASQNVVEVCMCLGMAEIHH